MSKSKETDHEGHIDHEHSHLSDLQIRVKALETVLDQKGYIDKKVIDQIIEHFESKVGPHIGAAIIARAWVDPEFKRHCSRTPRAQSMMLGFSGKLANT